jgi:predicted O-methyltransferase YrrM
MIKYPSKQLTNAEYHDEVHECHKRVQRRVHFATRLIPYLGLKRGAELGVAAGDFSEVLLVESPLQTLWSIDRWSDPERRHDTTEYDNVVERFRCHGDRSIILRMDFTEAKKEFAEGDLDFIYIDGYAHTGQESGNTLRDWWPKLRRGGIFAGHDYCVKYAKTMAAVDAFAESQQLPLMVAKGEHFASWFILKP